MTTSLSGSIHRGSLDAPFTDLDLWRGSWPACVVKAPEARRIARGG
jgi:hypothetical protein